MAVLPKVAQGRWRDSPSPLAGALWKSFLGAMLADGHGLRCRRWDGDIGECLSAGQVSVGCVGDDLWESGGPCGEGA